MRLQVADLVRDEQAHLLRMMVGAVDDVPGSDVDDDDDDEEVGGR